MNPTSDLAAEPARAPPQAFALIDILRAFAALVVVVYHTIEHSRWESFPAHGGWLLFRIGWVGVDLFFVISGFVIAYSAISELQKHRGDFRQRFFTRRLARIAPLYLLTLVVFIFLVLPDLLLAPWTYLVTHVGSHLLFLHNLHPDTYGSINGVNWSVGLEMQFYLFMIMVMPWLWRKPAYWVLALIPLAMLWRFISTGFAPPGISTAHVQQVWASQLPGSLDEFGIGIFLAMLIKSGNARAQRMLAPGWVTFMAWSIAAVVMLTIALQIFVPRGSYWNHPGMVIFWRSLLGLSFGCVLAAAITFPLAQSVLLRPLRYLGEISYGIYLWHLPVLMTLVALPALRGLQLLFWVNLGTCLLASLSWHWMEKPFIERFRKGA